MGRTNPTYRDLLAALERRWSDYRRALRRRDQRHFDRLFEHARAHADAAGYLNHDDPMVTVLVSVALAQERRIAALEARLDDGGEDGDHDGITGVGADGHNRDGTRRDP